MAKKIDTKKLNQLVKGNNYSVPLYWANMITSLPIEKIGVQKASGSLLEGSELDNLVKGSKDLEDLLGIILPLVIGGGVYYNSLPGYGSARIINGLRQTPEESLDSLLAAAKKNLQNVGDAFKKRGMKFRAFFDDVFVVEPHGYEIDTKTEEKVDMGRVGDVVHVRTDKIIESIYDGYHPILSHIGKDMSGRQYNINATVAAANLVKYLDAYKLLLLGIKCVEDSKGNRISNLTEIEARRMVREEIIDGGMALNIEEPLKMLFLMGTGRTVHITTTEDRVKELLTDGVGTMLRTPFVITSYNSFNHLEEGMLAGLMDKIYASIGKKLVDDYLLNINPEMIYLDKDQTTGAIIRDLYGQPYSCKIFKNPDFRGNGLASQIIEQAVNDFGSLAGRADINNNETCMFYKRLIDEWNNDGKTPEGKITTTKEIGRYLFFGINIVSDKLNKVQEDVVKEPATVINL